MVANSDSADMNIQFHSNVSFHCTVDRTRLGSLVICTVTVLLHYSALQYMHLQFVMIVSEIQLISMP